jgi:hypothetical protein
VTVALFVERDLQPRRLRLRLTTIVDVDHGRGAREPTDQPDARELA